MFEWIMEPTIWAGLAALIVLEVVLGIDNLVFIAILAQKLPPDQRDRARIVGLSLALLMRLGLLLSVAWLVTLTQPLFSLNDHSFSWRDLIMLAGGLFLIFKGTMELHERIEGKVQVTTQKVVYSTFGVVVAQIVIIDAVFSIDSVITAIGMTDQIGVMMVAMTIAMILMLLASKQLTEFVNAHPTLIILCLGFLLMIGFSLVAEGFGFHIPKGYLYAAIGFSILIEVFNQVAQHNKEKWLDGSGSIRDRTVNNMLRMMGVSLETHSGTNTTSHEAEHQPGERDVFHDNEKDMIRSILALDTTNIKALMTQRREVSMLDISLPLDEQMQLLIDTPYSRLVVIRDGKQDEPLGIVQKNHLLNALLKGEDLNIAHYIEQPIVFIEKQTLFKALEIFRKEGQQFAFVVDEFGILEGIITLTDIIEAITGEIHQQDIEPLPPCVIEQPDGVYSVEAGESIEIINRTLPVGLARSQDYTTLAGLILHKLERMPQPDEIIELGDWQAKVTEVDQIRISRVELRLKPE